MEKGKLDWETVAATVASVLASAAVFVTLYALVTLPVVETLHRL